MKFKQLRQYLDDLHRLHPAVDEADVMINLGHSVETLRAVVHFIQKDMIVLFPISVPTGTPMPTREEWERIKKAEDQS